METIDAAAFGYFSYGLYIVTARAGDRRGGQLANAVMQVCATPPRLAVCLNKNNFTHGLVRASGALGITVLAQETPLPFLGLFGFKSGREVDKLSQVNFKMAPNGCPLVTDYALAVCAGAVGQAVDVGTHTLFVVDVLSAEVIKDGVPLTYAYYHAYKKGRTPAAAPSYQPPAAPRRTKMTKYVCQVCGYIYDPAVGDPDNGVPAGTDFEDLPADWVCPVCGAPKDQFEPEA